MSLGEIVSGFLLSTDPSVTFAMGKLEFSVDTFRVDYEGYREIGHKIRSGGIAVSVASRSAGSTTAAVYTPQRDRISVQSDLDLNGRSTRSIIQQAMIVHECTHALMDFHRFQTTGLVQEATAYIAGQVYAAAKTIQLRSGSDPETAAILNAAFAVVSNRAMTRATAQRLSTGDPDVMALMNAIHAHRDYRSSHQTVSVDGISGGLINPWYEPRH